MTLLICIHALNLSLAEARSRRILEQRVNELCLRETLRGDQATLIVLPLQDEVGLGRSVDQSRLHRKGRFSARKYMVSQLLAHRCTWSTVFARRTAASSISPAL